jgi:ribosome maturation protein Sdo1
MIFRHGSQGVMDTASKASLENEFGTKSEDEAIIKILEKGKIEHASVRSQSAFHLLTLLTHLTGIRP